MNLSFDKGKHSTNDPRSRIFQNPEKLEDWELIAILLGKGYKGQNVESISRTILSNFSGLFGLLNSSPSVLKNQEGLGKAKVASLLAAREMVNRLKLYSLTLSKKKPITAIELSELLFLRSAKEVRECFYMVTLDHNRCIISCERIARGSLAEVGIYPRDLVKLALDDCAIYTYIAHNHPNQSCLPSKHDFILFTELSRLFSELEIDLLDQLVIGNDGVFSCKKRKTIFENTSVES